MAEDKKKKKADEKPKPAEAAPAPNPTLVKIKVFLEKIKEIKKKIFSNPIIQNTIKFIFRLGLMGWLKIMSIFSLIALGYAIHKTAPYWDRLWKLPYLSTFSDVSDKIYEFDSNSKVIRYNNDLLAPQHIVQINKIVVNIRPSARSTKNPMVAFDLYIKTDNEDGSIEIKDREKQLLDQIQRLCEEFTYDSILSEEGKNTWKQKIKRELNLVLTSGKVKDVYFKTLILKP